MDDVVVDLTLNSDIDSTDSDSDVVEVLQTKNKCFNKLAM